MISLFNHSDNTEIITRVNKLKADSKALWDKMQVHQMLAHLQQPLKVAFGEAKPKRSFISFIFGGIAKKRLLNGDTQLPQKIPTDKTFLITTHPDFEVEKNKLISYVKRFAGQGKKAISKNEHPFFGKMTPEDWDRLQAKHLDHHLRQFGV